MARDDPFAGIRLSEQTTPAKLDQRLFEPTPKPVPSKQPTQVTTSEKARVPAKEPVPPKTASDVTAEPKSEPLPASRFSLGELPLYKASYLFTLDEQEALEDLKLKLRRELDTKVTDLGERPPARRVTTWDGEARPRRRVALAVARGCS